jgi:hypothetical protein
MSHENSSPYYSTDEINIDAHPKIQETETHTASIERSEELTSSEKTLRSVIQLSEDIARYARQTMAMQVEANERGIDPQLDNNATFKKFAPLQPNENSLINLRGDLLELQTAMYESGIHVTADQLRERMAQMSAQGAFDMGAGPQFTETQSEKPTPADSEALQEDVQHLREILRAKAAIEFAYHPDEEIERKYNGVILQAVDNSLHRVGDVALEQITKDEDLLREPDSEAALDERLKALARSMAAGATERLRDAGGPTGGYYGGWGETSEGERVFEFDKVDAERWAHKAKWGAGGLNVKREEHISPQEQAALLKGYFAGELAMLSFNKENFRGGGAIDTMRLIAHIEGKSDAAVAEEYADLLTDTRASLAHEYQSRLDQAVMKIGLAWNNEHGCYQLETDGEQDV